MAKPITFHDYSCVVTDIDRRVYGKRIVPLKVLMLGMVRTGTECTYGSSRPSNTIVKLTSGQQHAPPSQRLASTCTTAKSPSLTTLETLNCGGQRCGPSTMAAVVPLEKPNTINCLDPTKAFLTFRPSYSRTISSKHIRMQRSS